MGVCVDTGHVGIRQARRSFARRRPDVGDLATLDPADPRLPELADDVQAGVADGGRDVLELMTALGALGGPVHHHLHDGHPLVRGLPDHRGFLTRLPVPFPYGGRSSLDPLFGPAGLAAIVTTAARVYPSRDWRRSRSRSTRAADACLSDDAAALFSHWRDTTNAERMNAWLDVLARERRSGPGVRVGTRPGSRPPPGG